MDDDNIVVSKEMLKAIGADTRINILKALKERQKTQSELASELKLSAPTVLEHVQQLEKTALVEKVEETVERKWKYYRLTKTGRRMVEGKRLNIVVLLGFLLLAVIGGIAIFYTSPFTDQKAATMAGADNLITNTQVHPVNAIINSIISSQGSQKPAQNSISQESKPQDTPKGLGKEATEAPSVTGSIPVGTQPKNQETKQSESAIPSNVTAGNSTGNHMNITNSSG